MKKFLYTMGVAIIASALTAQGEDINTKTKSKARTQTTTNTHSASVRSGGPVRTQSNISTTGRSYRHYPSVTLQTNTAVGLNGNVRTRTFRDRNVGVSSRTNTAVGVNSNARIRTFRDRNISTNERVSDARMRTFRDRNISTNERVGVRNDVRFNRQNNVVVNRDRNVTDNRDRNFVMNRHRNVTVNNNWRGTRFSGAQYAAFRNYHRTFHDRFWWRSHYPRIVFYFGSPYYWDAGYWFPCWGYEPNAYYQYDGPIYGYNGLAPDQVVVDVQSQLQRDGYYNGPIDGELGPMTRQAIADFQADHGLAITSAIDEPTLSSLGVS